jgi:hypothetical protein
MKFSYKINNGVCMKKRRSLAVVSGELIDEVANSFVPTDEQEMRQQYNEYILEAAENGVDKPMSWIRFKSLNGGIIQKAVVVVTGTTKPVSKTTLARTIFIEQMQRNKPRRETLIRFQEEANLTKSGSNTYYANLQSDMKHGRLLIPKIDISAGLIDAVVTELTLDEVA